MRDEKFRLIFTTFRCPSNSRRVSRKKKEKKITFKFGWTPHFTFGRTNRSSVVTDEGSVVLLRHRALFNCRSRILDSFFSQRFIGKFTVSSVTLEKHLRRSNTISRIAIAARAQLGTTKECVDYVLAEPLWSVEKRPTSPRPNAKDFVSPTIAKLIPLSFARIVRSESSSRFRWGKIARILNNSLSNNVDL